jgi:hypothetical protein
MACPICKRPVVIDPVMLANGEIVHAECEASRPSAVERSGVRVASVRRAEERVRSRGPRSTGTDG